MTFIGNYFEQDAAAHQRSHEGVVLLRGQPFATLGVPRFLGQHPPVGADMLTGEVADRTVESFVRQRQPERQAGALNRQVPAIDTGLHRWVRPFFGTLTGVTRFADLVVVATKSECILINQVGMIVKRLEPALALTPTQDHLAVWGIGDAQVLDKNGIAVTRWSLPPLTIAKQDRVALASAQGVLLFNNDWTFEVREDVG